MAARVEVVPATVEHARALAPRMRAADVAEILAASGSTPLEALLEGVAKSEVAATALFNGEVACMWGVVPLRESVIAGRIGAGWLLTSDLVERHPREFWRGCRRELLRLFGLYDQLINAIDARHVQALRWGRRLGFRLEEPTVFGSDGLPFCWFRVRKEDLHV